MKIAIPLLILLPLSVYGQSPEKIRYQERADSIIIFFLGHENFKRHVSLDRTKSEYRSRGNVNRNDFSSLPAFTPASVFFHYDFHHPRFSGETFVISFALDSTGRFIPGKDTHGIIRISSNDSAWTSAPQAMAIARDIGKRAKKRSLRLAWDSTDLSYDVFNKSGDFRDISPGDLVWQIDGEVLFRRETYSGTFQVSVQTGAVTKRFAIPWD